MTEKYLLSLFLSVFIIFLTGCGDEGIVTQTQITELSPRPAIAPSQIKVPVPGEVYFSENGFTIDFSNKDQGYVMVSYSRGLTDHVIAQIIKNDTAYRFDININGYWEILPLPLGDGLYIVTLLEHVRDQMFAMALSKEINVELAQPNISFLHPNQFVNFNPESNAIVLAYELAQGAFGELDVVRNIYEFIIANIVYDHAKADAIISGELTNYWPDIDLVLERGMGICFDYAALMTAMLRAQMIPTRLEVGYVTGDIYHAWISVYTAETGWVGAVQFIGRGWTRMDPTFSAGAYQGGGDMSAFIGDENNYLTTFIY